MVPYTGLYGRCIDVGGKCDLLRADIECNFFSRGKRSRGFKECFPDCYDCKTAVVFHDNAMDDGVDTDKTRDLSSPGL